MWVLRVGIVLVLCFVAIVVLITRVPVATVIAGSAAAALAILSSAVLDDAGVVSILIEFTGEALVWVIVCADTGEKQA